MEENDEYDRLIAIKVTYCLKVKDLEVFSI